MHVSHVQIYPTYMISAKKIVDVVLFPQLEAAKKTFHMACKEEKLASTREANSKVDASVTADQQKKLHEKADKCKQDSQKVRAPAAVALTGLWYHHYAKVFHNQAKSKSTHRLFKDVGLVALGVMKAS